MSYISATSPNTGPIGPDRFPQQDYVFVRHLIDNPVLSDLYGYVLETAKSGGLRADQDVSNALSRGADPRMEELLVQLQPRIEYESGLLLYPTYSFVRLYQKGAVLPKHRDREACELGVSISLGQEGADPWPLWIETKEKSVPVKMFPGDGVIYKGAKCVHWRDIFKGRIAAQLFLHYVSRHGSHSQLKFDGRRCISHT